MMKWAKKYFFLTRSIFRTRGARGYLCIQSRGVVSSGAGGSIAFTTEHIKTPPKKCTLKLKHHHF